MAERCLGQTVHSEEMAKHCGMLAVVAPLVVRCHQAELGPCQQPRHLSNPFGCIPDPYHPGRVGMDAFVSVNFLEATIIVVLIDCVEIHAKKV
jgi:hypothetical protein